MLIDKIEPLSKERSKVFLDNGEELVLYKGELRLLHIKEKAELSQEVYDNIMAHVLPKRAKLRAMNLLKVKPYTEYQLTKKLKDGGYPQEVIDSAIAYVKSFGYIDDTQYAMDFIRSQSEHRSKKELSQKLAQKGIGRDCIEKAFSEMYDSFDADESDVSSEYTVVLKHLKKKGYTGNETYEQKQKLLAYFYRRGFEIDTVYKAMDELKEIE